jgi:hypothetical protein
MIRFAFLPLLLALNFSMCKKQQAVTDKPQPAGSAAPATAAATAAPVVAATPKIKKPVVDQTAQVLIFCYHRLVDKIRYPGTEITPAAFEAQMKELKDKGITVISMQDLLAWKRGEKNIPPRSAVITFDDGWKSQYEVAWPIMKKYGYPVTPKACAVVHWGAVKRLRGNSSPICATTALIFRRTPRRIRICAKGTRS